MTEGVQVSGVDLTANGTEADISLHSGLSADSGMMRVCGLPSHYQNYSTRMLFQFGPKERFAGMVWAQQA